MTRRSLLRRLAALLALAWLSGARPAPRAAPRKVRAGGPGGPWIPVIPLDPRSIREIGHHAG